MLPGALALQLLSFFTGARRPRQWACAAGRIFVLALSAAEHVA
jgi:hypothetical protein